MKSRIDLSRTLLCYLVPLTLFGALTLLYQSSLLRHIDGRSVAITVDFLLTVPLTYYLLIRGREIPRITVVPVLLLGLLIGSYALPKGDQIYLLLFKTWALPVLELGVLAYVIVKVRGAVTSYKALNGSTPDFFDALKTAVATILPKSLVLPFATEVAVLYYGFISWKSRGLADNEFSYHEKSGSPALFGALILIIAIETLALHLLLALWSTTAAWVLMALSVYTAVQLFGFAKSLARRPISVDQKKLSLRYGIINETEIPLADIRSVELSRKPLDKAGLGRSLSPLGDLEKHNVALHLRRENTLIGLYGFSKRFRSLGIYVDRPEAFRQTLERAVAHSQAQAPPI